MALAHLILLTFEIDCSNAKGTLTLTLTLTLPLPLPLTLALTWLPGDEPALHGAWGLHSAEFGVG